VLQRERALLARRFDMAEGRRAIRLARSGRVPWAPAWRLCLGGVLRLAGLIDAHSLARADFARQ
jgi:hypothetical protein